MLLIAQLITLMAKTKLSLIPVFRKIDKNSFSIFLLLFHLMQTEKKKISLKHIEEDKK